jgi:ribosomal protein L7/L12
MNSTGTALESPSLKQELKAAIASGMSLDDFIRTMCAMHCNKIDSIKLLRELRGMSLADAKVAVHFSPAWADSIDSDNELHKTAFAAAEEAGFVEEPTRNQPAR